MSERKTGLAVIGLGMASKPHLEALAELAGSIEVTGVFNRGRDKSVHAAASIGCRVFDSIEEIALDPATDGVIVITPPHQRTDIIRLLAAAGKHVLTEKPVERSTAAAREIVETCERARVQLGVVFQHRMRAGARRLAELVAAGELGELCLVRADIPWWRPQSYYDVPGRGSYERDGGGVLISQAIHVLDLMLSLTGPADNVQAFCATTKTHEMESEDFAAAGVRYASGAVGSIVATTATYPGGAESMVIDGTRGTAVLKGGHLSVTWRDGRSEEQGELSGTGGGADPMAFPCDWHRDLIADFADAIRTGRPPLVTGRAALNVHALIDAMVTSSRDGAAAAVERMDF
ncbi:putative dehydrogenase [Hoeflea marina]|uniref:Putative dehydrogenase n=1 Tax=Hoeflea marina TaxID=274592 RepID=A0A317PS27_9HYPH|nr:Gfo/Idh/MocA family oxidoreductase [Hoeflea marina]PWW01694.1 putative dehydrogenase [Hoeflea marina]